MVGIGLDMMNVYVCITCIYLLTFVNAGDNVTETKRGGSKSSVRLSTYSHYGHYGNLGFGCVDKQYFCRYWKQYCPYGWFQKYCPKTCNLCNGYGQQFYVRHGGWSSWSGCSKTCKDGAEQMRRCNNPTPSSNGRPCSGSVIQKCNQNINCRHKFECGFDNEKLSGRRKRSSGLTRSGFHHQSASYVWLQAKVPYYFKGHITQKDKELIRSVMDKIEAKTCFIFEKQDEQPNRYHHHLEIIVGTKSCDTDSKFEGKVTVKQNNENKVIFESTYQIADKSQCKNKGGVLHELFHVLGVGHTHQRPDRNEYVDVHEENIEEKALDQYKVCEDCKQYDVPYDCNSIMHYGYGTSAKNGQHTMSVKNISCKLTEFGPAFSESDEEASEADWDVLNLIANEVCPEGCPDIDKTYWGERIRPGRLSSDRTPLPNWQACFGYCKAYGCSYWTYWPNGPAGLHRCYLLKNIQDEAYVKGAISGSVGCQNSFKKSMVPGERVARNTDLRTMSDNGEYTLITDSHYHLIIQKIQDRSIMWTPEINHDCPGSYFKFETDGNLVIYDNKDGVCWESHTDGQTAEALTLRDDGTMALMNQNNIIWKTEISPVQKPPTHRSKGPCGFWKCSSVEGCPVVKDRKLTSLIQLNKEYFISFMFRASKYINGYQSIIRFTSDDTNCCRIGSRIPAVWAYCPSASCTTAILHITFAVGVNGNHYFDTTKKYKVDKWHRVEISQTLENSKYIYRVKIYENDADINPEERYWENTLPQEFSDVDVYAGDKFYEPLDGNIKDLFINAKGTSTCSVPCPKDGWVSLATGCYQFLDDAPTFEAAINRCENEGGRLIEIESKLELDTVSTFYKDQANGKTVWLGATDGAEEGTWIWIHSLEGISLQHESWHQNEPNNAGDEDCVVAGWGFKWNDIPCNYNNQNLMAFCEHSGEEHHVNQGGYCYWAFGCNNVRGAHRYCCRKMKNYCYGYGGKGC